MKHDYKNDCQCYRCKGIRNNPSPPRALIMPRKARVNKLKPRIATRAEQHARYIDCGPSNWDDR